MIDLKEIATVEEELFKVANNCFFSTANNLKKYFKKEIKGLSKQELRQIKYYLSKEILELVEFEDLCYKYSNVERISDIIYFFQECRSIITDEIDKYYLSLVS